MRITKGASGTTNPAGSPKILNTTPKDYERGDFFRDLKKVVKKLPQDHPSRSDSRKR